MVTGKIDTTVTELRHSERAPAARRGKRPARKKGGYTRGELTQLVVLVVVEEKEDGSCTGSRGAAQRGC